MNARCLRLLALSAALTAACPDRPSAPPPRDAAADRARDVLAARAPRRRRGRARVRTVARNAAGQPNTAGENVLSPVEVDDTTEAPPRPRITETGPMLPENLGPPPSMTLDMGSESQGPMGLEPAQISRGLDPLLPRFGACAEATTDDQGHGPHGRVTIRLRIRNDGQPIAARVSGGGGSAEFVTCVRRVTAASRFAHFNGPDVFATWGFDVD